METIQIGCDGITAKWHWYNVRQDLIEQGGLSKDEILVNPLSVKPHSCGGLFRKQPFYITWVKDTFLLLSIPTEQYELVEAFSKVLGYSPFGHYSKNGMITFEWDKQNPQDRIQTLERESVQDLVLY